MKKGKVESRYESFGETRRKCFLLAKVNILKGHLKYHKDPVGMFKDPDHSWFVEPFRDYCLNVISFKEAQRQLNEIRSSVLGQLTVIFHNDILRAAYKKKTGRDFDADLSKLKETNKEDWKEAAINLVKSFKTSYSKNPIRNLIGKAIEEGDEDFLNAIANARFQNDDDAKRNMDMLYFTTFHKAFLDDPDLSEDEVLRLARKVKVLSDMVLEESFLKCLRREGVRMKSRSQLRKEKFEMSVSPLIRKKLESKKSEFPVYLFENFTPKQVKQEIQKIKKSILA